MPNSIGGRYSLRNLFGRYSLPSVMGRLFNHGDQPQPITPQTVDGGTLNYSPYDFSTSGPQTSFNTGADPTTTPSTDLGFGPNIGASNPYDHPQGKDVFGNPYTPTSTTSHSGGQWGGTLGGGTALDPSAWGSIFGNDAGNSVPQYTRYASAMGDGGGFGGNGLVGSGMFAQHYAQRHGGGYDSSGINPGGMYTGGNTPPQVVPAMQTGGNTPASTLGRLYGPKPPPAGTRQ